MMLRKRNAVYTGVVLEARDPKHLGRVRISLPAFREELWARVATLAAGDQRGSWFVPEPGDEVVVAFEAGDARRPFVIGSCWEKATPPESDPARRVLRTRNGATVVFDDGAGAIEIEDASGNAVVLTTSGITITASAKLSLAAGTMEISAAELEANAGMSRFSGVVRCDTLIATSVVAENYTPGAGNVL
jgi:phage baseplate assembly protein V